MIKTWGKEPNRLARQCNCNGSFEKMTNRELKEYLNTFPDDAEIRLILANPIFCIDVGKESDMDAELVQACEEDEKNAENLAGQMNITDYPEVLP